MSLEPGNPLSHVVPHSINNPPADFEQMDADLGLLTPEGVITLFSDQIVMMIVGCILLCTLFPMLVRKRRDNSDTGRLVTTGFSALIEMICQYWLDQAKAVLGEDHAYRFVTYLWSVFFFILTINLLGLLPLAVVMPAWTGLHIGGTATGNIWVTATLACVTMVLMVVNGLRFGGKAYLAHFSPGPLFLAPLMIPLEIIGLFAKIFALTVRLFANMLAGHVLLAVLVSLVLTAGQALGTVGGLLMAVPIVLSAVAINMLEIFVAFLQAFIFTYLTMVFISLSVNVHHDDHHEAEAH